MLSRSSVLRYVLVAVISAATAMALVATAAYARNGGFNDLIVACFESRDPDSEYCRAALEVSPVDSGFFVRLAENLDNPLPKPEPRPDLKALAKECAATKDLDSEECARAIEASGLSLDEFKEKFAAKLGCLSDDSCARYEEKKREKSYSEHKKYNEPKWNGEMTEMMRHCLELKAAISGLSASELMAKAEKLNYVCGKAYSESGLTPGDFWSKYRH